MPFHDCQLFQWLRGFLDPANALPGRNPPMLAACRGRVSDTAHCCAPPRAAGQR